MKHQTRIFSVALVLLATQSALAQFGRTMLPDIQKAIKKQEDAIKSAKQKAEKSNRDEEARKKREAKQREEEVKAKAEANRKKQEEEQLRLKELNDIKMLREAADLLLKSVTDHSNKQEKSNAALQDAESRLAAKEKAFDDDRKVFELEKQKLQLENDLRDAQRSQAEDSGWKWFLGFLVTTAVACVGAVGGVLQIIKTQTEIKKLKLEASSNTQTEHKQA